MCFPVRNWGLSCVQNPILAETTCKNPDFFVIFFSNDMNFPSKASSLIIRRHDTVSVLRSFTRFGIWLSLSADTDMPQLFIGRTPCEKRENDVQLIQRILSGDEAAFDVLVQRHQKSVHALAWRKIGDFHDAEEITQDTFLQVYKKLPTLKDPYKFAGWLYVITNRLCIDRMREKNLLRYNRWRTHLWKKLKKSSYTHHVSEQRRTEITEASSCYRQKTSRKTPRE